MHLLVASWFHGRMKWDMMISWHCLRLSALKCPLCMAHSTKSPTPYSVRLEREHSTSSYGLMYACIKPGFHYPSWRPELKARVDGWPVSITRQHWRGRVSTSRVCQWQSTMTIRRSVNSANGNARPSTRPVLTGNGNRSPVNSGL